MTVTICQTQVQCQINHLLRKVRNRYHAELLYFLCYIITAPPAVTTTVPGNLVIDNVERDECIENDYENPASEGYMRVTGAVSRRVSWNSICEGAEHMFTVGNEVAMVMFLQVCVYSQGGVPGPRGVSAPWGCLVWGDVCSQGLGLGDLLLRGACSRGCLLSGGGVVSQHALRQTPALPGETATAADGTHPTGMHSCCSEFFV